MHGGGAAGGGGGESHVTPDVCVCVCVSRASQQLVSFIVTNVPYKLV